MPNTKLLGIIGCCCALVIVILALGPITSTQGKILSDYELSATFGGTCGSACVGYTFCVPYPNPCVKSGSYWYKYLPVGMLKCMDNPSGTCTDDKNRVCARKYKYVSETDCLNNQNPISTDNVLCVAGCDGSTAGCP